ncbi:ATP-binding protein [Streptomyces abyssomicinicus]|uniref:ATP-binding protein n=1 Tax=Streptomyces abyssomicinicus TaxID=574929 RepID=UPI0013DEFC9E|nr:LuxR family transcriptional regulator [Streptomyces abyssomicinicus]
MAGPGTPGARSARPGERRRLIEALAGAREGRRIVELAGDPGSGKTKLLAALMDEARSRGFVVAHGRATELDQKVPLHSITATFDCGSVLEASRDLPHDAAALVRAIWAQSSVHISDGITDPSGAQNASEKSGASGVELSRGLLLPAMRGLLGRIARNRPTVLILDDCHWMDHYSAELIDYLIRYPVNEQLLIVLSHRPRQMFPWLRSALAQGVASGVVERITLGELTLGQSAELLSTEAHNRRCVDLHRESQGVPQYLLALADEPHGEVLASLVQGEISQLRREERWVLEAGAVLDGSFDVTALAAVAGVERDRACVAASALLSRDLLRRSDPASVLVFRHPLVRDAVYGAVDNCWRREAHRRAVDHLRNTRAPASALAAHVAAAPDGSDSGDVEVLLRAAAEVLPAADRAIAWLEVALRMQLPPLVRGEVLLALSRALCAAERFEDALPLLREAVALGSALPRRIWAKAVERSAMIETLLGRYSEAEATLDGALASFGDDASLEEVGLLVRRGVVGLFDGHTLDPGTVALAARIAHTYGCHTSTAAAMALRSLGAASSGDMDTAEAALDESAVCVEQLADAEIAESPDCLALLGWAQLGLARFADAEATMRRGVALTKESGETSTLALFLIGLSLAYSTMGRIGDSRRAAVEVKEWARRVGAVQVREMALALEANCAIWLSRTDDSKRAVSRAQRLINGLPPGTYWYSLGAAMCLAASVEMEEDAERCMALVLDAGGGAALPNLTLVLRAQCFELLCAAAIAQGSPWAAEYAEQAMKVAEAVGLPYQRAFALSAQGHVLSARGDVDEAAMRYREAADLFATHGALGSQARALTLAARCAAAGGSPDRAAEMLRPARELAMQCGSPVLLAAGKGRQGSSARDAAGDEPPGGRERRLDLSCLTDREREIAGIAGSGRRTKEIAEQLCLSPRTVEVHLSRIYRKLNVPSRAALARLMARAA